jgi:hypothetical protein
MKSTPSLLSNLTSIDLGATLPGQSITNESLVSLKGLTNLTSINLHYCEKVWKRGEKKEEKKRRGREGKKRTRIGIMGVLFR